MNVQDVARWAMALPEVEETTRFRHCTWVVGKTGFAWERPYSKADLKRFGNATPPAGEIVAVRLADLAETEAVLAENRQGFFTIEHFNGFPALLVQLDTASAKAMREILVDGWLACAPAALAKQYIGPSGPRALESMMPK